MEELGIIIPKQEIETDFESKSFIVSSQYEQLENDDLYTKFKVVYAYFSVLWNHT